MNKLRKLNNLKDRRNAKESESAIKTRTQRLNK